MKVVLCLFILLFSIAGDASTETKSIGDNCYLIKLNNQCVLKCRAGSMDGGVALVVVNYSNCN